MISISSNSMKQTLQQYLSQYKSIFKKRSFYIFSWVITAILCMEETRSIKFLYDNFIKKYCDKTLNCFYYFLSYSNFSHECLMKVTANIVLALIPSQLKAIVTVFLTIDDTLQAKYGEKFDCYFKLFDHTSKNGSQYLNGHCFVSLVINIPIFWGNQAKYVSIPLGYRLYDKLQSKLQIAATLIDTVMPLLSDYQVILLCDSWYPKGEVIEAVKAYENLDIICAVRSDTVLYDLPPARTGKRGRPHKHGERLDIKNFSYEKEGEYYFSSKKVLTNLFGTQSVLATITVKDVEAFNSVRLYISTIDPEDILIFKGHNVEGISKEPEKLKWLPYFVYSFRWNIEVIFYEHKFFWSFGNYMVRSKLAIERYVNLLAIAFTFVQVLPYINQNFKRYSLQSPQVIKHVVMERLSQELIFGVFVSNLENSKIYSVIKNAVNSFLGFNSAA